MMNWEKLGRIFCPGTNTGWMKQYATLPVINVMNPELFRIYFSVRDEMNRSLISWIEIKPGEWFNILNMAEKPVLSLGSHGEFDAQGTMVTQIFTHNNKDYMYYIGWNTTDTVPFRNAIGLAIKEKTEEGFRKCFNGPILDRSKHDKCFVASCEIIPYENKFLMYYLSCDKWSFANGLYTPHYKIKIAESWDLVEWKPLGKTAIDFKNPFENAISTPRILLAGDHYKMWYSYRGQPGIHTYRIGYAESENGIDWIRLDEANQIDVSPNSWDSEMLEYPYLFIHDGETYMLYNGNSYGKSGFGIAKLSGIPK